MRAFLLGLAFGLGAGAASACTWMPPADPADAVMADLVVLGRLTGYRAGGSGPAWAIATLEVREALVGDPGPKVDVLFHSSMGGAPDVWRWPEVMIVAAMDIPEPPEAGVPDMPVVIQRPCAAPFVLEDTPENRAAIAAALANGPLIP